MRQHNRKHHRSQANQHQKKKAIVQSEQVVEHNGSSEIIMKIKRMDSKPNGRILELLPALSALNNNEHCSILKGNREGTFRLRATHGMHSLQLTRWINQETVFKLDILCKQIASEGLVLAEGVKIEPSIIKVKIFVL